MLPGLIFLLLTIGCGRSEAPAEPPQSPAATVPDESSKMSTDTPEIPVGDTSRNSLDWAGTYSGVLPCASCPGIETTVTLKADGSYERSRLYIDESAVPKSDSGTFKWNDAGSKIALGGDGAGGQQYQVGENQLFQLDQKGERITGDVASKYVLQKHLHDPAIEDQDWQLVELRGQPVEPGQFARDAAINMRSADFVASGNTSCNTYSGSYAIKNGQRISFAPNMAVTMMACPDMNMESAFLDMLKQVDNYAVSAEGMLSLHRARMAPLARFAPVKEN
jgi:heat shock protein HslJ